jgi:hypothetical protein
MHQVHAVLTSLCTARDVQLGEDALWPMWADP